MSGKENEPEQKSVAKDDISERLEQLGAKLDKLKKNDEEAAGSAGAISKSHSQMGAAFRITSELVGPVLVSTFIGYWLDNFFETKPVLIIIFFLLGVVTGFWTVIREAQKMQQETIDSGAYDEARDIPFEDDEE